MKYYKLFQTLFLLLFTLQTFAQVYTDKIVGKKNKAAIDSLKKSEWPYSLPIWGKKVTAMGYKLPYAAGVGVNYFWQKSELVIDNLNVGFNGSPMVNLDEIVRFKSTTSEAAVVNVRPDIWILPFLNVYAIFATSKPSTQVDFGIWIPDTTNNWKEIYSYSTKAKFNAHSIGFGLTPTIGIGGGWMALDMNWTWTDVDATDKPVYSFVFGPRFGKSFNFKKPDQNIALWVGGFRVKFASATKGSLALSEVVTGGGNDGSKIDAAQLKVTNGQQQVDSWWNGLTPPQQNNPVNKAKYETANRVLTAAGNFLNTAEGAINNVSNSTVQYSLDKSVKDKWNFIVGSQFQLNRHWMIRAEYGFLGSREQFLAGLQYRFGL